jgi:RNA polymerase sigma-70 factor (ECF subfamily)
LDLTGLTDDQLAARFREGNGEAFETLLSRYSGPLYNFALRFLGNPDDAQDAVQQTFIQAFEFMPDSRGDGSLRPWLFQVARNKCIDLIRKRRSSPMSRIEREDPESAPLDLEDAMPLPAELYERAELQRVLQEVISLLPVRSREVVLMRYTGEMTFAEIGRALGMPENTAKTLFQRAKVQLRAYLKKRL